jgi:antitoxin component YwqK of YwqJK toxin-antitoxin module
VKPPLLVLILACVSLLLVAPAVWLLRHEGVLTPEAGRPSAVVSATQGESPDTLQDTDSRELAGGRTELALADEPSRSEEQPADPAGLFPWGLRDPPQVDGPVIESYYAPSKPEFLGTQVLDDDGKWVRDGPWTAWYENGQVCELGAYRAGAEHGPWQWYYEDGTRMAEGGWVDGKRVGEWTFWHENGALGTTGSYADGVGCGVWTLYHESGWKWAEGPWANGAPNGHWNVWNEDGTLDLERTGTYVDGGRVD